MAQDSPWSVKGVAAPEREAAKVAARKAGVPIGAWLSEAIRRASDGAAAAAAPTPWRPGSLLPPGQPVYLPQRLANRPLDDAMVDAIRRLGQRLDETERRMAARLAAVIEQVEATGRELAALGDRVARLEAGSARSPRAEEPRATAALERALARLSARLEQLESDPAAEAAAPPAGALARLFGRR